MSWRRLFCALALATATLGLYLLTNPGRIESIDGQYRWEVAKNLLDVGEPTVRDQRIFFWAMPNRETGKMYSGYNIGASATPIPLMVVSHILAGKENDEASRFAFALTGGFFGAFVVGLLVLAYGALGLSIRASVVWAAVFGLCTGWWPGSTSVLDQNQHAAVATAALLLAWQAGRRESLGLAAAAGLVGGLMLAFQENYALLLPMIAIAVFAGPGEGRGARAAFSREVTRKQLMRYGAFGAACAAGLGLFFAYNFWRFDAFFMPGRYDAAAGTDAGRMTWGNPVAAVLSLLVSPGKGILFYSPPIVLAVCGMRRFFRRAPVLFVAIAATTAVHVLFISRLTFFGGDWCWGPRYLLVLLPAWALIVPFAAPRLPHRRVLLSVLFAVGLVVQVMAHAFDYHRFFFERDRATFFYIGDEWVYFRDSQLIARAFEIRDTLAEGIPETVERFGPTPQGTVTYTTFGPPSSVSASVWMRRHAVWYLPFPWPLWIWNVDPALRPVGPASLLAALLVMTAAGLAALRWTLLSVKSERRTRAAPAQ